MSSYTIPYVTTRTGNGERTVDIYSRLLADRIIYLGTGIDDGVANAVIAQLLHLENDNPDTPISFYINSVGGSIPATLAIYDAMQFVRPAVETTCVGQAAATAAVLLAGGAAGRRSILPHGRVVIHAPAAEGRGAIPDLILEAEEVERVRLMQELILAVAYRAADRAGPPGHRAGAHPHRRARRWPTASSTRSSPADPAESGGQADRSGASVRRRLRGRQPRTGRQGQLGHRQLERSSDRRHDLRRRVLLAALQLGQVLRRHTGTLRDIGDPLTASHAIGPQLLAKALPPQRFHLGTRRRHRIRSSRTTSPTSSDGSRPEDPPARRRVDPFATSEVPGLLAVIRLSGRRSPATLGTCPPVPPTCSSTASPPRR